MKIAFISYDFPEYCIRQANAMSAEHEVMLVLPTNEADSHLSLLDSRVRYEPFRRPRFRHLFRQMSTISRIVRTTRAFKPDVIHFQHGHMLFNLALPLLKKFPLVMTIHNPRHHPGDRPSQVTPQWIMDFGYRRADHVIVHGESLKQDVVDELGFRPCDVHVIPHVAIGDRAPDVSLNDDGATLLFFGRIWEYKGLEYLIRAEPLVSAEFPNLRIVIGGRGEDFDRYRRMMVHPERFEIHNEWITDEQRAQMFAAASVVVLPYIEASQSGVIPIAYSYEKPVIATCTGGLPDVVDHGRTGLLVPPRDEAALAEAILQLLRDRQARIAMGQAGKEKLERECSPDVVGRQTLDVYRQAIRDRRNRRDVPASQVRAADADLEYQPEQDAESIAAFHNR